MTAKAKKLTGWALLATLTAAVVCPAALGSVRADLAVSQDVAEIVQQDLRRLAERLHDPAARQDERDEAARRLVSRRTPEARRIVADALVSLNPGGQLAAVRALSDDPQPDPTLINPLFAVLGTNRNLTEAAARALANYKAHPDVVRRLIEYVERRPPTETARFAVIRAIGSMPDKSAAQFLVDLLARTGESPAVRAVASEALHDLGGMPAGSMDVQRWQQWWSEHAQRSDAEFRAHVLTRRAVQFDQVQQQLNQLAAEVTLILREQYRNVETTQRAELLLRYLRSPEPHVRLVGAGIIHDEALDGKPPPPGVREHLREMIGDSSASVRAAVANALGKINDAAAFEGLLAQLSQEPDSQVRASLARALGPIQDLRAVPVLVALLGDPSQASAAAAADALKQLGRLLRETDAELTRRVAIALRETLEERASTPDAADFRADLVEAMVELRQEELRPILTRMLDERRGESPELRRLAIRAIGEIANPQSAAVLISALDDRSERIRLEAVQALAKSPALAEHSEALRKRLDPEAEPDEPVRLAAWRALETVFPQLSKDQLNIWAERFREEPPRRLIALKALADQQLRDRDEDGLATTRENIGAVHMTQGEYREAGEYFRLALDYKKTQGVPAVIDTLMRERMKALLLSRDYPSAIEFAASSIREAPVNAQIMGGLIRNETETLKETGELQQALDLIAAANKMDPPLSETHRAQLVEIEREIQLKRSQQNGTPAPAVPRSANNNTPPRSRAASLE